MQPIPLVGTTIPHEITVKLGGAKVILKPASLGTGVKAGGPVRAVLEAAGVRDILTKSLGSANVLNVAKATLKGLQEMTLVSEEASNRGKDPSQLAPFWERKKDG
jgi:small subunit ribosomal protein S5